MCLQLEYLYSHVVLITLTNQILLYPTIYSLRIISRIGSMVGLVLSNVFLTVVSSSLSTVLVCFAVDPFEFKVKHPELSHEMRECWRCRGATWSDEDDHEWEQQMTRSRTGYIERVTWFFSWRDKWQTTVYSMTPI